MLMTMTMSNNDDDDNYGDDDNDDDDKHRGYDDGREDLDAMEEAMVEAKAAGVNEAAAYMVESSILKDRGEKQLEAQTMLTQALASLSKSKMRGMSLGPETPFLCFFSVFLSSPLFSFFFSRPDPIRPDPQMLSVVDF